MATHEQTTHEEITFDVPDMKCEGCAERIRRVLERHEGVRSAEVSLEAKRATARFDAEATGPDALQTAIENAGYSPTLA